MIFRPWMRRLATVALVASLALPLPATARPQGPQTAVLQIRVTVVAAAASRCSVGMRRDTAGTGDGVTAPAADGGGGTLDIRCASQSSDAERPEMPPVLASGQVSASGAGSGSVALAFRPGGERPDDRSWTRIRPLVSYRTAPARSGTLLLSVEY